jgi:hypothetical protein
MATLVHTASFHTAQRLSCSAQSQHRNNIGVLLMHASSKIAVIPSLGRPALTSASLARLLLLLLLLPLHPLSRLLLCYWGL